MNEKPMQDGTTNIIEKKRNLVARVESAIRFFEVGTNAKVIRIDVYHAADVNDDIIFTEIDIETNE